jgi:DNA/RNA endonuclease YhcR with UshA esterase domain
MKEGRLLAVCLCVSLSGLALLAYVSHSSQPPLISLGEIGYDQVGSLARISGEIASRKDHRDGHIFLRLEDGTGEISVVLFRDLAEELPSEVLECLQEGRALSARGRLEEYRGALEIVPRDPSDLECLERTPG